MKITGIDLKLDHQQQQLHQQIHQQYIQHQSSLLSNNNNTTNNTNNNLVTTNSSATNGNNIITTNTYNNNYNNTSTNNYPTTPNYNNTDNNSMENSNQNGIGETSPRIGGGGGGMVGGGIDEEKTNLIVNYLPQTMSQDDIRSLFSTIGELESCKLIRDKATGQSLGYGFINYRYPDHSKKAIYSFNALRLQNKTIKVSYARPSSETIKGANLYVSGLAKGMTQSDVDNLFAPYGVIVTSRILCDPLTGLSKGVAFVRYDTRHEAEQAIKHLNGTIPQGATEPVTVKFANCPNSLVKNLNLPLSSVPFAGQNRRMINSLPHQHTPTLGPAVGNRFPSLDNATLSLQQSLLGGGMHPSGGWCIFVYNLAPETEDNVLWQLFGPFGAVQNVKVMRDPSTQKCKGFGFVTMTNYDEALAAVGTLNGYHLGNRVLQVSFKKSKNTGSLVSNSGNQLMPSGV